MENSGEIVRHEDGTIDIWLMDRPLAKRVTPQQALQILYSMFRSKLHPDVVRMVLDREPVIELRRIF